MRQRAIAEDEKLAKRRSILDAALALYLENSRELPSVSRIAEASGLAKGTVYLYFRTKEEIFLALLDLFRALTRDPAEATPRQRFMGGLLLGAWIAVLPGKPRLPHRVASGLHSAGLAAILVAVLDHRLAGTMPWLAITLACTGTALVLAWVERPSWLAATLGHPLPAAVGLISYPLYLWHWPVFVLLRWTTGLDDFAADPAVRVITAESVRTALEGVSPDARFVLVASCLHGRSDPELASLLGLDPITIRTMRSKARANIRARVAASD